MVPMMALSNSTSDIARAVSYSDDEESAKSVIGKKPSYGELEHLSSFYKEKYLEAKALLDTIAVSKGCIDSGKLLVPPSLLTNNTIVDPQLKETLRQWQTKMGLKIRAEEHCDTKAFISIGKLYEHGDSKLGFPVDRALAFANYQAAADCGDLEGIVEAANCRIWGFGTNPDIPTGVDMLLFASSRGSAAACRGLGEYHRDMGANAEQAILWFKKALDRGCIMPLDAVDRSYVEDDIKQLQLVKDINEIVVSGEE